MEGLEILGVVGGGSVGSFAVTFALMKYRLKLVEKKQAKVKRTPDLTDKTS